MINIDQLSKQLTHDEYEAGRNLFSMLREQEFTTNRAVGIVYRAGRLKGKADAKDDSHRLHKEISRLHDIIKELRKSQPEAAAALDLVLPDQDEVEEGSTVNE